MGAVQGNLKRQCSFQELMPPGVYLSTGLKGQGDRAVSRTWIHRGYHLQVRDETNQCPHRRRNNQLNLFSSLPLICHQYSRLTVPNRRQNPRMQCRKKGGGDQRRVSSKVCLREERRRIRYSLFFDLYIYLFNQHVLKAHVRVCHLNHGSRLSLPVKGQIIPWRLIKTEQLHFAI